MPEPAKLNAEQRTRGANDTGFLHRHFLANSGRRIWKWAHYFDIYERHFARFRDTAPVMLEIGIAGGGSLEMWREYFGPGARIIGLDIDPACKAHESDQIEVFIGDQADPAVLAAILSKYPRIDIVLDDGSHMMTQVLATFAALYDRVHSTGVYMVEDMHTSYWPEYGGGLRKSDTFIEYAKNKIDALNAAYTKNAEPISSFTRNTDCISFYDSVVIFEKRPQGQRQAFITAAMQ